MSSDDGLKTNNNKQRIPELDVLKGVGIFLMVFDHVGWGELCHTYIQSFHMPLFFIVSGFLFKKRKCKEEIYKRIKNLLIPYYSFGLVYLILSIMVYKNVEQFIKGVRAVFIYPTDIDCMPFAPALWFFPRMFIVDVLYNYISNLIGNRKYKIVIILLISCPVICFSIICDNMLPFAIEPVAVGLIFFMIGDLIKNNENELLRYAQKIPAIIMASILHLTLSIVNQSCDMRSARYHNIILYFIDSILGTFVFFCIASEICKIGKTARDIFAFLSRNAIVYICMNQILISAFNKGLYMLSMKTNVENVVWVIVMKCICFNVVMFGCAAINHQIRKSKIKFILGR